MCKIRETKEDEGDEAYRTDVSKQVNIKWRLTTGGVFNAFYNTDVCSIKNHEQKLP